MRISDSNPIPLAVGATIVNRTEDAKPILAPNVDFSRSKKFATSGRDFSFLVLIPVDISYFLWLKSEEQEEDGDECGRCFLHLPIVCA